MGKKVVAAVAAVLSVAILGAGLAGAEVEIRPPDVKFKLSAYGTLIDFETDATARRITVGSNIVFFERLKVGTHTAPLAVSVQSADMTIKALEEKIIEFDLAAPAGTESYARLSDGGRKGFFSVLVNQVRLRKFTSWKPFQATNAGWYHDKPAGTIHVKTVHSSVNSVSIQWGAPSPAIWVWLGVGAYEDEEEPAESGAEIQPGTYTDGEWVPRERFSPGETLFLRALVSDAETSDPVTFAQVPMTLAYDGRGLEVRQPESGLYEGSLLLVDIPADGHTVEVEVHAEGYTDWSGEATFHVEEAPVLPPAVVPWWRQWWAWLGIGVAVLVAVALVWRGRKELVK
ncbi:hypothetical protein ES706_02351 [subsurface metagenome]